MNSFYDRLNTVSVLPGANPSSIDIMFDELPQSKRPAGKTLVPSSEFDRLSLEELLHNGGNNPHSLLNALAFFKLLEAGSLHRATERTVSNKETEYLLAMGNVGAFAV
ncbi:MAG: hypothetical protein LBQ11_02805, partial [Candidatus Nomurabacteria bacterium]|nr:hypothetical protein [Candidatus Nomurabacteria bacterium]